MLKIKLFIKMVVTYFCIIISTLLMLGVLLSFLLNNYLIFNKQMEMLVKGRDIAQLIQPYLVQKRDPGELIRLLNRADKNLGTEIWVIDSRGYVIAAAADQEAHEGNLVDFEDIAEMQQNKVVIRQGKSRIYDEPVLWVITPVEASDRIIGGVILYSPIMGITRTMTKVRNLFIYSALVSIIFSTLVVYYLSKYVTGPLREMNRVAKKLACGHLAERVTIQQGDEIGDLASSFNFMAAQIEKQEKMRRDFVADVSHELRSPLTNIQGFIEAMIDGKDKTTDDRSRYLGILYKETLRLTGLVNQLLDLSRLESGALQIEKKPVDIIDVIKSSLANSRPVLEEKGLAAVINGPERVFVMGSCDRLGQVISNLLDNSARHSPQDGQITVNVAEKHGVVEVLVKDEGEGIPAEELTLIWERFYKADKARTRDKGGTGLGLAIVKKIIESHNGRVKAASEEGKGAEIGFELPVSAPLE
ncbi:MAG: hypothetical protein CVU89_07625 [Firmicutes bacterium HGW-Firmicutes-14]|nr:MAG: hypothetical protein CVU89_07625 [Firmicutes bacterium HGW-Firmicutes-14]